MPLRVICGQYFQESSGEKIFASERQLQNWQTVSINGAALDGSLSQFFNKEARRDRQKASAVRGVWHPLFCASGPALLSNYQMPTFPQQKPTKTKNFKQRAPALSRVRIALSRPMSALVCGVDPCFISANNCLYGALCLLETFGVGREN